MLMQNGYECWGLFHELDTGWIWLDTDVKYWYECSEHKLDSNIAKDMYDNWYRMDTNVKWGI